MLPLFVESRNFSVLVSRIANTKFQPFQVINWVYSLCYFLEHMGKVSHILGNINSTFSSAHSNSHNYLLIMLFFLCDRFGVFSQSMNVSSIICGVLYN